MAKFREIIQESNENLLIKKFIRMFYKNLRKRLKKSRRFSFVLTGGESPIKLYRKLANTKYIPWKKIDFFIGDERYVKENSKYSNIRLCKKYLLNKIKISNHQIYQITTNQKSLKKDAYDYEFLDKLVDLSEKDFLHTDKNERVLELGLDLPVCRVIVNQAHTFATGGSFNNGLPFSLSMGCGTWQKNNIDNNLNYKHFINITKISTTIEGTEAQLKDYFEEYCKKYDREEINNLK